MMFKELVKGLQGVLKGGEEQPRDENGRFAASGGSPQPLNHEQMAATASALGKLNTSAIGEAAAHAVDASSPADRIKHAMPLLEGMRQLSHETAHATVYSQIGNGEKAAAHLHAAAEEAQKLKAAIASHMDNPKASDRFKVSGPKAIKVMDAIIDHAAANLKPKA